MRPQLSCFRGLTVGLTCPEPPGQGRQFFLCTCVYLCSRFGGCASLLPVSGPVIFDRVGYLALNSWINVYHFTVTIPSSVSCFSDLDF